MMSAVITHMIPNCQNMAKTDSPFFSDHNSTWLLYCINFNFKIKQISFHFPCCSINNHDYLLKNMGVWSFFCIVFKNISSKISINHKSSLKSVNYAKNVTYALLKMFNLSVYTTKKKLNGPFFILQYHNIRNHSRIVPRSISVVLKRILMSLQIKRQDKHFVSEDAQERKKPPKNHISLLTRSHPSKPFTWIFLFSFHVAIACRSCFCWTSKANNVHWGFYHYLW